MPLRSLAFPLFFMLPSLAGRAQVTTTHFTCYSAAVGDTFEIYLSCKGTPDPAATYATAWYSDADIESGIQLREALAAAGDSNTSLAHTLFVGIGQRGNYNHVRRRDLVPPLLEDSTVIPEADPLFRHANRYYRCITQELMPLIAARYHTNDRRTLIGHSFGGLFVCWCLFTQEPALFRNYIALSPSLWKNCYNIFDYEAAFHARRRALPAYLYLSSGCRENLNFVLSSVRRMKALLDERRYEGLILDYAEHKGKTHASQVPVSMAYIMRHVDF